MIAMPPGAFACRNDHYRFQGAVRPEFRLGILQVCLLIAFADEMTYNLRRFVPMGRNGTSWGYFTIR
jgi:hypothetical protein